MLDELESYVKQLPLPRPSFIELSNDAFIRKKRFTDRAGIDQLLAMTPTERLQWNEEWRQFIRRCEQLGYTPSMIAEAVWGEVSRDE